MAGELPLGRQDEWTQSEPAGSVLDRHFTLSASVGRWIAVTLALLSASLLRIPGLDRWALTAAEAETATAAHNLLLGNDVSNNLLGRPFMVEWTALFMFLGHSSDPVARMSVVLAGLALIVVTIVLGRQIGPLPAVATAIVLAFSPTMIANSRRLDGGMLVALLMLTLVALTFAARDSRSSAWPAACGVVAALLILCGPLGIAALLLGLAGAWLLARPAGLPGTAALATSLAGFAISYVLLATVLFTRPVALLSSTAEIFRLLFSEHLANIGQRFHVPLFNLIVNEPLLIALALVGAIASSQRAMVGALTIWSALSLFVISLLGDTGIAGHALVVLPLALLAGFGVAHLVTRIPWPLVRRGPGALYAGAVLLLFLAMLSLIGILTPDAGLTGWDWVARLVLVVVVVVLPLAVFVSLIAPRISGNHLILVLSTTLLVLSVFTVRSAVLAASDRPGQPMDPLAHQAIGASLPQVLQRVERVSVDLTRTQRTAQDPTGGHGLAIAIDEQIEQPLLWYLREFPNVTVFDPASDIPAADTQVVFLSGSRDPETGAPGMRGETYPYAFESPDVYSSPDWGHYLGGLFSIGEWRNFWGFMIERTAPPEEDRQNFQFLLSPGIAESVFGPTGPFALDELAGAGTEGGQFNSPRGIAISEDGRTYVVDSGNQRIQVFDADGEFLMSFGEPGEADGQLGSFGAGQGGAGGIAISGERVYVTDTWNHRVQVFSLDGEHLLTWGSFFDAMDDPAQTASNPGLFYGPRDIAVAGERVYVSDTGNERVQVFDLQGEFVQMWGTTGTEPGQLLEPVGIAVHDDTVYVADSHNARIARYSLDGEWLEPWDVIAWDGLRFFEPYLEVLSNGVVLATTSNTNEILMFEPDGSGGEPVAAEGILRPFGIAAHPTEDEILVTDGIRNGVLPLDLRPE